MKAKFLPFLAVTVRVRHQHCAQLHAWMIQQFTMVKFGWIASHCTKCALWQAAQEGFGLGTRRPFELSRGLTVEENLQAWRKSHSQLAGQSNVSTNCSHAWVSAASKRVQPFLVVSSRCLAIARALARDIKVSVAR